ncbi:hypothetical protein B0E38_01823 [Streptomyces sp. 111WW2]|uniref:hypothetical protein n=1 Tax=Streptomyces sp. 111WW2 TaxID=1945515 RepID=UPI000D0C9160|nr:hypothetical protein [Streptomyces sp. 111WW2]PSK57978.1 hypothetical protein B0E38_01823 [Streptomyces sp. 111WW2]
MADPAYVSGSASAASAASVVALVQEAAALAVAHFDQLPPDEEAAAYVTLTSSTGYGVITLGMWLFLRDAEGTVTLYGSEPEADHG